MSAVMLFQVAMNITLDTVRPEWRDPEYGHRMHRLRRCVSMQPGRPVVVVLGSSRPQMGLSPAHLGLGDGPADPLAFSVCQAGCGPVQQLLTLRRLRADGVRPAFVLAEVLPPVLAGDAPAEALLQPARLSLRDIGRVRDYCDDPSSMYRQWAATRASPWYTLRQHLMSHWQGGWMPWQHRVDFQWKKMDGRGWLPYFYAEVPAAERERKTADARAQYAGYFADFRLAPRPARALAELVAEGRAAGAAVAFFVMPEGPTFRSFYPPAADAAVAGYLDGVRRDLGVPVFDARAWLPDDAFADGHHLLRSGAEAFSRRFGAECVGPWVRAARP